MFTPIASNMVEMIKAQGEIKFFVFEGWEFIAMHEIFTTIPHKIVYLERYKYDANSHYRIFDCKLTLSKYYCIIEEITVALRGVTLPALIPNSKLLSKPSEYMFLEMTLEAAENLAKLNKKERLVITSNLSTFSEIASESNFIVKKPKFSNYFRATKIL